MPDLHQGHPRAGGRSLLPQTSEARGELRQARWREQVVIGELRMKVEELKGKALSLEDRSSLPLASPPLLLSPLPSPFSSPLPSALLSPAV